MLEVGLGVLAALAEPLAVVEEPGAGLLDDAALDAHVDEAALARDAEAVDHLELRRAVGRGDLVLDDLHAGARAHHDVAFLDVLDAADLQALRRVELQRQAAGRRLGVAEHDADLVADLVDEDERAAALRHGGRELAQRLRHQARLQAHVGVAHLALDLGLGHERRDGVHHDDVERGGAHELLGDLEGLLAAVGLGDEHAVDVHAELAGVAGVHGVLGVDVRRGAAGLLGLRDGLQREGGLARGLGTVDLDDAAAGEAPDAEREVERKHAGGDRVDLDLAGAVSELHHGFLAVRLLDLSERELEGLRLTGLHVSHVLFCLPPRGRHAMPAEDVSIAEVPFERKFDFCSNAVR
jgi:hypothetical protein